MYDGSIKILTAWMQVIFFAAVIIVGSRLLLFEPISIHGESMSPTIQDDDRLILAKVSSIQNFDMIVFSDKHDKYYIKRVIGLPGDLIEIKNDMLFINGIYREEYYLDQNRRFAKDQGYSLLTADVEAFKVPEDEYYVLGDNRIHSVDSRVFGFIAKEEILGEAKLKFSKTGYLTPVK